MRSRMMPQDKRRLTNKPSRRRERGRERGKRRCPHTAKVAFPGYAAARGETDQRCPQRKTSQIGYLILPTAGITGLLRSARPVSNATVHFLFLAYICNIRTSGFLCGLLVCSLGPFHPCARSHLKIHTEAEGVWGVAHHSDGGLRLGLAAQEDLYSHVERKKRGN